MSMYTTKNKLYILYYSINNNLFNFIKFAQLILLFYNI